MANKQQHKKFLAIAERSVQLRKEEDKLWLKLRPWHENPYYPKPWSLEGTKNSELEIEMQKTKAKTEKTTSELLKLHDEMYPENKSLDVDNYQQQPLKPMVDDKTPLKGEDLVRAAEEIFGVKSTERSPKDVLDKRKIISDGVTDKGKAILERFNSL